MDDIHDHIVLASAIIRYRRHARKAPDMPVISPPVTVEPPPPPDITYVPPAEVDLPLPPAATTAPTQMPTPTWPVIAPPPPAPIYIIPTAPELQDPNAPSNTNSGSSDPIIQGYNNYYDSMRYYNVGNGAPGYGGNDGDIDAELAAARASIPDLATGSAGNPSSSTSASGSNNASTTGLIDEAPADQKTGDGQSYAPTSNQIEQIGELGNIESANSLGDIFNSLPSDYTGQAQLSPYPDSGPYAEAGVSDLQGFSVSPMFSSNFPYLASDQEVEYENYRSSLGAYGQIYNNDFGAALDAASEARSAGAEAVRVQGDRTAEAQREAIQEAQLRARIQQDGKDFVLVAGAPAIIGISGGTGAGLAGVGLIESFSMTAYVGGTLSGAAAGGIAGFHASGPSGAWRGVFAGAAAGSIFSVGGQALSGELSAASKFFGNIAINVSGNVAGTIATNWATGSEDLLDGWQYAVALGIAAPLITGEAAVFAAVGKEFGPELDEATKLAAGRLNLGTVSVDAAGAVVDPTKQLSEQREAEERRQRQHQ